MFTASSPETPLKVTPKPLLAPPDPAPVLMAGAGLAGRLKGVEREAEVIQISGASVDAGDATLSIAATHDGVGTVA